MQQSTHNISDMAALLARAPIQFPFNFHYSDISILTDIAVRRFRKDVAFIGKPINQQNDKESLNNVSCDFIKRLNSNYNQTNATNAGCLAGIGFTMSLFIASLALDRELIRSGKLPDRP